MLVSQRGALRYNTCSAMLKNASWIVTLQANSPGEGALLESNYDNSYLYGSILMRTLLFCFYRSTRLNKRNLKYILVYV